VIQDLPFKEVWLGDFEFGAPPGERPEPVCLVARELLTGRLIRLWQDDLKQLSVSPYGVGPDSLFVAYYASAELGCHLALGWPIPARVLDLCAEFRNRTAGLTVPNGRSLLGALSWYGLDAMAIGEKESMRQLIMRGGPWSGQEQKAILAYCQEDVDALARLLPCMLPEIDLPRALLRGRYMAAAARIEWNGVPIDTVTLNRLRQHWGVIQERLIAAIDADYGVFEGRTFKAARWAEWLIRHQISWPLLESGGLALDDDTFRDMAHSHPQVALMRELRHALSQMRLTELKVGGDSRNRTLLSAFASKTSRNQPSNTAYIFGPSVWLRSLIKPEPGRAVAYIDWAQQEFGIAAALSGDAAMMEAYSSGDPYLAFAKQAGCVPPNATKESHETERDLFKTCVLGVQYVMGEKSLAGRIGQPTIYARELLHMHRETYKVFWRWSDSAVDYAMLHGYLPTVFGWRVHVDTGTNPRSLRNFPMQANGAEMLRLACCLATEDGISVCGPVHDALLIEDDVQRIQEAVIATQKAMVKASQITLGGFSLRSDAKVIVAPNRYADKRGKAMWERVMSLLPE
jgi:DNA polymerase I